MALDNAIKRAGVPRVTPHGLRHSMASAAAAEDVSIKTLQVLLGHAHYSTTADIYTHVDQHTGKAAAKTIAKAVIPARLEIA
ncbi:MAG: tyrosine-type recombinase/integrase [bacterium]